MRLWEDYLILPDSPYSTLPGFGTIISLVVVPDDDEDQIILSEPVVSPVVPSFNYPSLPDYPLAAFLWENDTIRRGDTPRTDTEAPVILTPASGSRIATRVVRWVTTRGGVVSTAHTGIR